MSNLYKYKYLNFGIVMLCPNLNICHLINTVNSLDAYYPNIKSIIILPANCSENDITTSTKLRKTYKAGRTMSSMINCGLENAPCKDWNILLLSKGWLRNKIDIKYSYFIEGEKDILFPITDKKTLNFVEEKFSLLIIHNQSFEEIGKFPDMENLEISKLIWATKAIEKKYKFKGIVGGKLN